MGRMSRRGALGLTAAVFGVASLAIGIWGIIRYQQIENERWFYYVLTGYKYDSARFKSEVDAAAQTGWVGIMAWILFAAALLSVILAIATRPIPKPDPAAAPEVQPVDGA